MNPAKGHDRRHLYEFAAFRLDPAERVLTRGGLRIPLPPKAFDTLLILVGRNGHVVTKEDLLKAVWPDTFVEENNLTQHISMLRKALGQSAGEPEYIETVPRIGYRFVAPVRDALEEGEVEVLVERQTRTHVALHEQEIEEETGSRRWLAASAAVAVVGVAILAVALSRGRESAPQPQAPRSIAVVPFRNLNPDGQSAFLSYSLADAINHRLGYFSGIVVRPSSYMAAYGKGDVDPRTVASELHVQTVLTGSYIKEGDLLRVSAELVDVAKDDVLWRDTFDVPYIQLLTVQDRVAESVAHGLQLQVLPQEAARLKRSVPQNPLAYEFYLRAQDFGHANDYRSAVEMLEKSVQLDASYAPAWMTLGNAYANYGNWQNGGEDYRPKSRSAFDKALQLDPELPLIHAFMAAQMMEHGDLEGGVTALRQELRLNPNQATAHWWMAEADLYGGMLPESIAEGERALRLDPLVNGGSTFNSYLHAGDYDEFLATLPAGGSARTTFYRGLCLLYMGQSTRAAEQFAQAFQLDPTLLHAKYGRALLYAIDHQSSEGLRYLKDVERTSPTADGEMLYKMSQAYNLLGDRASAFRLLRQAIDHSFYCDACFARDPLLASLRGEPQYRELVSLAGGRHERFKRAYF